MHVRLLAFGTRGDVQPYVALALGLQGAGIDVSVAATGNFQPFIESYGIKSVVSNTDIRQIIESAAQRGRSREAKWLFLQMMLDETYRLAQGADLLIYSPAAIYAAPHVAEKLGIPAIATALQPFLHTTGDFPAVGMPPLRWGAAYNRFTYAFVEWLTWTFTKRRINRWRETTLGLTPTDTSPQAAIRALHTPVLYGISPYVLPRPTEFPPEAQMTGYWFLPPDPSWQPPVALVDFLGSGTPPVYIGFGSMASEDPDQSAQLVLSAVQQAGVRAVLATGWSGLSAANPPESVFVIESAPHEWLLQHVSAVVHHGGAGTTGTGLRAGVPNLVVPFRADQPFWGAQVERLGAGPTPIPRRRLTADNLAAALRAMQTDTTMRQTAASIGARIRAEDGVGKAVEVIRAVSR